MTTEATPTAVGSNAELGREIERLRFEVGYQRGMYLQSQDQCAKLEKEVATLRRLLYRYRTETPLGHQPHMIALEADKALGKA